MDDHYSPNDDFGTPTLAKEVVRRYERQSQNDFEIDLFRGILKRRPEYVDVLRVLANNLAARGDRKASLAVDRRLVRLRPHDAIARYNLACSLCVLGRQDEAMDNLERALELGYEHLEYLTEDRDLAPLHRNPRFLKMLSKLLEESEV
jgi:tetratricopeptide (TPR) repeat protein